MARHLILTATDLQLADAWQKRCGDLPNVSIYRGSIIDVACDAIVSPANSFGFMDGGIDLQYTRFFGIALEQALQQQIQRDYGGELLVGQATLVATRHPHIPYLIAAPTMRTPARLSHDTPNPYLAARSIFRLWKYGSFTDGPYSGERIASHLMHIATPGLGTGIGEIAPERCAQHVRVAIEDVLLAPRPFPRTWSEVQLHQQRLDA